MLARGLLRTINGSLIKSVQRSINSGESLAIKTTDKGSSRFYERNAKPPRILITGT